jgi:hypothetical protein
MVITILMTAAIMNAVMLIRSFINQLQLLYLMKTYARAQ